MGTGFLELQPAAREGYCFPHVSAQHLVRRSIDAFAAAVFPQLPVCNIDFSMQSGIVGKLVDHSLQFGQILRAVTSDWCKQSIYVVARLEPLSPNALRSLK